MSKDNDIKIESYDGQDAFYSGTDEDYEEFLKSIGADDDEEAQEEAEPVENTQKINLSETINLQGVIDKFKKKAEDLGQGARMVKESVKEVIRAKREEEAQKSVKIADKLSSLKAEKDEEKKENPGKFDLGAVIEEKIRSGEKKIDQFKKDADTMSSVPDRVESIDGKISQVNDGVAALTAMISDLNDKISMLEAAINDEKKESNETVKEGIKSVKDEITDIRQSITSVSRLNDSVFDLKNTQLNTKNSISNLEIAFSRLKKKCVLGVTVLSILSAVIIALEIILMLS